MIHRQIQIIHAYVSIGGLLWLSLWLVPGYGATERIILLAAFVVVPMALYRLLASAKVIPIFLLKAWITLLPLGALALSGSFLLEPGWAAGLLALPWTAVTMVTAGYGVMRFRQGAGNGAEMSKAIGLMYISVGGIWLIAHQWGASLLGFEGQIMLLTVNHFHYAGFVAPILFGFLHGSRYRSRWSGMIVVFGGISPILIALGMTYSPTLEGVSVIVFSLTLILYSTQVLCRVVPTTDRWTKWLHLLSGGVVWLTMALVLIYGWGEWVGQPTIPISTMVLFHGWGNAVIFSFLGLLAWHATLMDEASADIPFSRIEGKGKIGAHIFSDLAVMDQHFGKRPSGLVDEMKAYDRPHFDSRRIDLDIVSFYERTGDYELRLVPHWHKGMKLPARLYRLLTARVEQMNFPLQAESDTLQVQSEILPIEDEQDGRRDVRAWVRTYQPSGKAIYAALYSTHSTEGTHYMNIAFPLPFCQMTSILHLQHGADGTLILSSWPANKCIAEESRNPSDQGVYLVSRQKAIRLPINETITVWKDVTSANGRIEAKHEMWLYGMKFLTLDYHIYRKTGEKETAVEEGGS